MRPWLAVLIPGAIVVLSGGCGRAEKKEASPAYQVDGDVVVFRDEAARASAIRVHPVARSADGHVTLTGRLVWDEDATVRVFVPVGGRVQRILADLGAPVARGTPLATLASPDFGQAQADAARARSDLMAAERTLARGRLLLERGAAPRKDVEQAEAEVERARAEAERTRARLSLWGGASEATGTVDQEYRVSSPMNGVVVERNLNPGQEVRTDATSPLFVISDPRRLWVLLDVTERDLQDIAPGASLVVRSPAYPDRAFSGTLDVVGATLDPATRTVRARGKLPSPDGLLKAEMYVSVDVYKSNPARYVVVPVRSVLQDGGKQFVFLEEAPGRYRRVQVAVGAEREGAVPILSGLLDTARVVTEGSLLLEAAWAAGRAS
jgi:cobalt-zinc-cadmium efflux system membrane fusion protein